MRHATKTIDENYSGTLAEHFSAMTTHQLGMSWQALIVDAVLMGARLSEIALALQVVNERLVSVRRAA